MASEDRTERTRTTPDARNVRRLRRLHGPYSFCEGDRRKDCSAYDARTEPIMHAADEETAENSAHGSVAQGRVVGGLSTSVRAATLA